MTNGGLDFSCLDSRSSVAQSPHVVTDLPRDANLTSFPLPQVADVSSLPSVPHPLLVRIIWPCGICSVIISGRRYKLGTIHRVCQRQVDSFEREVMELVKPSHGTTTLGFIFEGGVIIAVDSRASMGSYICAPLRHQPAACIPGSQTDEVTVCSIRWCCNTFVPCSLRSVPDSEEGH